MPALPLSNCSSSDPLLSLVLVCQVYKKSGMLNSTCKNCGKKKEGCGAWLRKNQPDALWKICASESGGLIPALPNMVKVTELVNAGIDVNYAVSGRDQGGGQARDREGGGDFVLAPVLPVVACAILFPRSFPSRRSSFTHSFTHVF